ncbi:MAG: kdgR 1 [Sporomusa sp.]|nr:kdgR 1 [Sporomusa sp.]
MTGQAGEGSGRSIQSVFRSLKILEYVAGQRSPAGLTEISKGIGIHKSTAHGLIATMEKCGFMQQDPNTGKYSLGIKVFEMGQAYISNLDLRELALPYLKELSLTYQETAHLAILSAEEVVYIDKVDGSRSIGIRSQVGGRNPAHCTGVGKVLLSGLDERQIKKMYLDKTLRKYTRNTVSDLSGLLRQICQVRKQGYAIDLEEFELDLRCIAAPIKDSTGAVLAAVSISGPSNRLLDAKMSDTASHVIETAMKISIRLGYKQ